mgnify:CR=1 FL=1
MEPELRKDFGKLVNDPRLYDDARETVAEFKAKQAAK